MIAASRHSRNERMPHWRFVALLLIVLAASAAWHLAIRPWMVVWTGSTSLGAYSREPLVRAAVCERYPALTSVLREQPRHAPFWMPRDYVKWYTDVGEPWTIRRVAIADANLRLAGTLRTADCESLDVGDFDGDGRLEVISIAAQYANGRRFTGLVLVVRPGTLENEICAVIRARERTSRGTWTPAALWAVLTPRAAGEYALHIPTEAGMAAAAQQVNATRFGRSPLGTQVRISQMKAAAVEAQVRSASSYSGPNPPSLPPASAPASAPPEPPRAVFVWNRPGGVLVPEGETLDDGLIWWRALEGNALLVRPDANLLLLAIALAPVDEADDSESHESP